MLGTAPCDGDREEGCASRALSSTSNAPQDHSAVSRGTGPEKGLRGESQLLPTFAHQMHASGFERTDKLPLVGSPDLRVRRRIFFSHCAAFPSFPALHPQVSCPLV